MTASAQRFSRRQLILGASAASALARVAPVAADTIADSRIASSPLIEKGFASVRKIGAGVYATISNPSKGFQTTCNGGFLVGKHGAFLIEAFNSVAGASFQMDALRQVSRVPVVGALVSHYHYDHSMGGAFYGAAGIPLWAHATAAKRMVAEYSPMQGAPKETVLAPFLERVRAAKSELARTHAETDLNAMTEVFDSASASQLGLPNRPLDQAKLPMTIDLGGPTVSIEFYSGHSGTDLIVRVPNQNVVYTGDLLFNGKYPVCFDEQVNVKAWCETLKKFAAFDKDTLFVAGHGPVCGQNGIAAARQIFDDIIEQTERLYRKGVPLEQAEHAYVIPEKYKALPLWSWHFTVGSAIANLYSEWKAASR
jgi:glyoxylase-like metal-dependent hydrolase (beta-lactamase superfamily II)